MITAKFKTLAATSVALTALLALGACNKKVEDTNVVPTPAPMTTPSTDTPAPTTGSPAPMGSTGSGMSPTMPEPTAPASAPK